VISAIRLRGRASLDGADRSCRVALIAGGSAMGAFVLVGLTSAAGWLEAPLGLVGATFAIVVYVASLVYIHRKEAGQ
jgi:hypothetical protein